MILLFFIFPVILFFQNAKIIKLDGKILIIRYKVFNTLKKKNKNTILLINIV